MTALTPMLATMLSMSHGGGAPVMAGPEAGVCTIRLGGRQFTVVIPQALATADSGNDEAVTLEDLLDGILSDEAPAAAKDEVAGDAEARSEQAEAADPEKRESAAGENDEPAAVPSDEKPVEVAADASGEQAELSAQELADRLGTVEDRPTEEPSADELPVEQVAEAQVSDDGSEAPQPDEPKPADAAAQDSSVSSTEEPSNEIAEDGASADDSTPAAADSADDDEDDAAPIVPIGTWSQQFDLLGQDKRQAV